MAYGNYAPFYRAGYFNPMQAPSMPQMADNQNQFAQPYQAQPQQPQMMPTQMQGTSNNDIIWVQGEAGAKAYLVAPSNTVTLWDSENPTIYVKSADINGVPSMRILDFTERMANAQNSRSEHVCKCGDNFVQKEKFEALQEEFSGFASKIKELEEKYAALTAKSIPKTNKTTKTEDE